MKKAMVVAVLPLLLSAPFVVAYSMVKVLLGGISGGAVAGAAVAIPPAMLAPAPAPGHPVGLLAAGFALAQVGTPYRWGAERPGYGFDCSGLAQAAWRAAGIRIPRVAQDQHDAGPMLPPGAALQPGDLVFFGPGSGSVTHVGIVVGNRTMVDAPHTGSAVRVEPFPASIGASWGGDEYLGAARPSGW